MKSTMIVLLAGFMAAGAWAGTVDTFRYSSGSFVDVAPWENGGPTSGTWTSTSSSDELKFSYDDIVCTVDTNAGVYPYKAAIAAGLSGQAPVLQIVAGGSLTLGEVKFGDAGTTSRGDEGVGIQTGGTFTVTDLELGYKAGGVGYYTISGGTLTYVAGSNGRIKLGAEGADGAAGTLTVVGTGGTINMRDLYVGDYGGDSGTGNLEFRIGASGVSPVGIDDDCVLDDGGTASTANLLLSATAAPARDIVLVHNTGSKAVVGVFDAMNGGSAAEGTTIALGDNTYSLSYIYDADSDSQNNDIALVYGGLTLEPAHDPNPADGASVLTSLALLDWINPEPNTPGDPVYCDVYLGTEPNRLGNMDRVTLGNDISEVAINTTNFPVYGDLQNNITYYWAVDVHDVNLVEGPMWSFTATDTPVPTVDAGPDQGVWLGMSGIPGQEVVYLDGTTSAQGPYTVRWTQVANGAPAVSISPNDVDDTSVTITAADTYEFMLTVDDGLVQVSDTVQIIVVASPPTADGFGQYTTGGEGGTTVTVNNAADFELYVESDVPYIIRVEGTIDLGTGGNSDGDGEVNITSDKTISGVMGTNPTIIGQLSFENPTSEKSTSNIIIERLTIISPTGSDYEESEGDGIAVKDEITNVFVTKCTFIDCEDGCLDVSNGSDYITVSWCKFYYINQTSHRNVNLIGSADDKADIDMGKLHVTFHHNWWSDLCTERMPSVRFGRAHVYNNYYNCPGNSYCVRTRLYAECLVENNYFKDVQNPWERLVTSAGGDPGLLLATGNILVNPSWDTTYYPGVELIDGDDTVFTPPYPYTLDDPNLVPGIVQWGAGADGKDGYPPHWYHTMYGDFDISGLVEFNDLQTFAGYWMATNNIDNADYYDNGCVDLSEFSLFAEHYLAAPPDTTPPAKPAEVWALGQDAQVSLDWADNSEEDFVGYNIYRSTSSGIYDKQNDKLNESLLTGSAYVDDTAANGTLYYYVVTAVDTSDNESPNSVEACADPNGTPDNIIIQEAAMGFCDVDGQLDSEEHPGYTGYGYIDTENAAGNGINWSINIASAGTYTLTWRFANGSSDRPAKLLVNDVEEVAGINFPATGAWENWTTVSTQVTLTTGIKDIRLEATTSGGCANIDYFQAAGAAPEIAVCQ